MLAKQLVTYVEALLIVLLITFLYFSFFLPLSSDAFGEEISLDLLAFGLVRVSSKRRLASGIISSFVGTYLLDLNPSVCFLFSALDVSSLISSSCSSSRSRSESNSELELLISAFYKSFRWNLLWSTILVQYVHSKEKSKLSLV